jgi:hypothetical protein
MRVILWSENLRGKDLGVDGSTILEWILVEYVAKVSTGFN